MAANGSALTQADIDRVSTETVAPQVHWIDGKPTQGSSGATLDVISPIDGRPFATIAEGSNADVDAAVNAARRAFEGGTWSRSPPAVRKRVLLKIAELLEREALSLAVLGVRDNGTEITLAHRSEPLSAAGTFRYYAEAIDKVYGEIAPTSDGVLALIQREPLGVVGAIVPWNMPLMIAAWKVAPALAAGNSVVLKPAEIASLTLLRLAAIATEAGIPDGVFNVVTGRGAVVGEAMGLHAGIDVLAFTGSGAIGRCLLEYSARSNLKRIHLELGGKSPNIVFSDAPDLEHAARMAVFGMFRNSGQICVAGSRLLLQSSIHDAFLDKLVTISSRLKVGNPLLLDSDVGAIASAQQLRTSLQYSDLARKEGATCVLGGSQLLQETGGYYMAPTIFSDVDPTMTLAREEVFGPVLAVMRFETTEEAVRLANETVYGLAAAVWTSNLATAHRMVRAVRAGLVHVNTYGGSDITVPLGGFGQSGFGRDKSLHALDKYTDLKTAWISI